MISAMPGRPANEAIRGTPVPRAGWHRAERHDFSNVDADNFSDISQHLSFRVCVQ